MCCEHIMLSSSIAAGCRMLLQHGVLVKEDGLDNNVLKIKPPLVFSKENADAMVYALQESLNFTTSSAS